MRKSVTKTLALLALATGLAATGASAADPIKIGLTIAQSPPGSVSQGTQVKDGAEVAVNRDGEVVRGVFESIDDTGRLIVRGNDNARIAISAGDVHFGVTASVRA